MCELFRGLYLELEACRSVGSRVIAQDHKNVGELRDTLFESVEWRMPLISMYPGLHSKA